MVLLYIRVLGGRAVVNPPQLLEIGTRSQNPARPSTPEMLTLPSPAMEEVQAEDIQGPALEQPEPEPATEQPVPETAEQSVPGPSCAKKRKLMKVERAQKEVSATLSKLTAQGVDLKSTLILLDDWRAKREAEQMKREKRESRMFDLLSSIFGSSVCPCGQHSTVPPVPTM